VTGGEGAYLIDEGGNHLLDRPPPWERRASAMATRRWPRQLRRAGG